MSLQGKTAVITGGGSGIGAACALALAQAGAKVAIAGRRAEKLREVAAQYRGEPAIQLHECDVANRDSVAKFFKWAEEKLGRIDILVHAAGINIKQRLIADLPPEKWDELISVNATGAFNCLRAVLPAMRERGDGLVINISSVSGVRAHKLGGVAYAASKFAMGAMSTAVANEVGPSGVRISTICPGEVDTPILENRPNLVSAEHRARIMQPADIAAAVLMICQLPPRAHVAEMIIKPTWQEYV